MPRKQILGMTRLEIVVVVIVLAVVAFPFTAWPHWEVSGFYSCHRCGNRKSVTDVYRWYRKAETRERFSTDDPIPARHVHEWYRYGGGGNRNGVISIGTSHRF
jgi:hypothetical protein